MRLALVLTAAFFSLTQARADDKKTDPKAVIKKAIEAHGGEKNLKKYQGVVQELKGTINVLGQEVEFTGKSWSQGGEKNKTEMAFNLAGMEIAFSMGFNKDKAWMSMMGVVRALPEQFLKSMKGEAQAEAIGRLYPLLDKKYKLTSVKGVKIDKNPTHGVKVEGKGMKPVTLYFDQKTNLLMRMAYTGVDLAQQGATVKRELTFSGYKKGKQGIPQPAKFVMKKDGDVEMEAKLKTTLHEKLKDSSFAQPD